MSRQNDMAARYAELKCTQEQIDEDALMDAYEEVTPLEIYSEDDDEDEDDDFDDEDDDDEDDEDDEDFDDEGDEPYVGLDDEEFDRDDGDEGDGGARRPQRSGAPRR